MRRAPDVPEPFGRRDQRPCVIVHGGAESRRYHNVLEALETALALQADLFEFDVRRTADGVLVVHHDEVVGAAALRDLSFEQARRAAADDQDELPRLERILARARGRIRLDVELKETGDEAAVLEMIRAHGFDHQRFVVTAFEQRALDAVHAADPEVVTGLLVYDVSGAEALELFRHSGTAFLGPDHAILDDATLRAAANTGVLLTPWTVNDSSAMRRLLQAEAVIGLITDDPASAIALR